MKPNPLSLTSRLMVPFIVAMLSSPRCRSIGLDQLSNALSFPQFPLSILLKPRSISVPRRHQGLRFRFVIFVAVRLIAAADEAGKRTDVSRRAQLAQFSTNPEYT